MKKFLKRSLFIMIMALVVLGIFSNVKDTNKEPAPKKVTYYQLEQLIKKNEKEKLKLHENEDGTLLLKMGSQSYVTHVSPKNNNIPELIQTHNISYQYKVQQSFLDIIGSVVGFLIPVVLILFFLSILSAQKKNGGQLGGVGKPNTQQTEIPNVSLAQVGGVSPETKKEIEQIIETFKQGKHAKELGITPPKGALFYGPPGTGKTLLAKAVAKELGANFYAESGSSFVEMFVGVGASRVRGLFEKARKNKPALIFIDEIDAVAGKRGTGNRNEERENTLNELLTQLDGMESNEDIFVIATTNRLDILDPAVVRSGRFDQKTYIGLPDKQGRREIIDIHRKGKPLSEAVLQQLEDIAASTTGYSGADIESLFKSAANHALMNKKKVIEMEDMHYAIDRMILGNQGRVIQEMDTKKRVAYHEAGHALIGALVKPGQIRKATILPRGQALGFVAYSPKEMELSTRSELMDQVKIMLAGGVAEMKMFGEHSIGVGGDVQQARALIEKMTELGMGTSDFQLAFEEKEKTKIMTQLYKEALAECKKVINQYEKEFEKIALALLEFETLEGKEIESLVYGKEEPATPADSINL